jgi:hypothetical protein
MTVSNGNLRPGLPRPELRHAHKANQGGHQTNHEQSGGCLVQSVELNEQRVSLVRLVKCSIPFGQLPLQAFNSWSEPPVVSRGTNGRNTNTNLGYKQPSTNGDLAPTSEIYKGDNQTGSDHEANQVRTVKEWANQIGGDSRVRDGWAVLCGENEQIRRDNEAEAKQDPDPKRCNYQGRRLQDSVHTKSSWEKTAITG